MYEFNYTRATSVEDALKNLEAAEDGKLVAGGMTLVPTMKQRLASPSDLIDIGGLESLQGVSAEDGRVVIGAMTTHANVASNQVVRDSIPALTDLANHIGDPAVRNRGTIGGSVANADPAADYPAAVLGLNAEVQTNQRTIAADDFFVEIFETALEEMEIVTSVSFPVPDKAAYMKFPNPASRYAIVGVMVAVFGNEIRVAVTGAGPNAFRVQEMESALTDSFTPEAIQSISISDDGFNSDIHASAEYRAHLVNVMARRAVTKAG